MEPALPLKASTGEPEKYSVIRSRTNREAERATRCKPTPLIEPENAFNKHISSAEALLSMIIHEE